ncbi:hypothetical protein GW777_03170 [Candidatus Peregrinibacteria bacterium]|nr:hypothetical protein [Candidatus Peregrinibacteria bacterium]
MAYPFGMDLLNIDFAKLKKILNPVLLNRVMIAGVIGAWLIIFFINFHNGTFDFEEAVKNTGGLAWYLLLFVIFISLAQKLMRIFWPKFWLLAPFLPLRKWAGIFVFLVVCSHVIFKILLNSLGTDISAIISMTFSTDHAMIFGSLAFLVLLPLFLTSTQWAVKRMGFKAWKRLQRFSHLAFVLAALHVALIDFFSRGEIEAGPILLLTVYFAGYGYLWWHKLKQSKTMAH